MSYDIRDHSQLLYSRHLSHIVKNETSRETKLFQTNYTISQKKKEKWRRICGLIIKKRKRTKFDSFYFIVKPDPSKKWFQRLLDVRDYSRAKDSQKTPQFSSIFSKSLVLQADSPKDRMIQNKNNFHKRFLKFFLISFANITFGVTCWKQRPSNDHQSPAHKMNT